MDEELKSRLKKELDIVLAEFEEKLNGATLENIDAICKELDNIRVKTYKEYRETNETTYLSISNRFTRLCINAKNKKQVLEYSEADKSKKGLEENEDVVEVDFEPDVEEKGVKNTEKPEEERKNSSKEELRVKVKEDAKDKKMAALLVELSKTQATKLILTLARDCREMQAAVNEKTGKLKGYLENQAEIYGANKEKINELVETYKNTLEREVEEAKKDLSSDAKEIAVQQRKERDSIAKLREYKKQSMKDYKGVKNEYKSLSKDYARAVRTRDKEEIEKLEKKREKLEYVLESYENDMNGIKKDIKDARDTQKQLKQEMKEEKKKAKEKLTKNKVHEIIEKNTGKEGSDKAIIKQSAFGKFIGFMSGIGKKIGGNSAFKKKVLNPVGDAVKGMTEKAKGIPGNVKTKSKEIIEELKTNMQVAIIQNNEKISEIQNTKEASTVEKEISIDD